MFLIKHTNLYSQKAKNFIIETCFVFVGIKDLWYKGPMIYITQRHRLSWKHGEVFVSEDRKLILIPFLSPSPSLAPPTVRSD